MEKSKGKNRVQRVVVPWTTGFKLPEAGGVLDQSHRLMMFFEFFIVGDRRATHERLNASN